MYVPGGSTLGAAQLVAAMSHRNEITVRLLVALALTWAIGFERVLRGSAAGDRTFSLLGLGSAIIGYLALDGAPNALAGVVTGIGFIGAGVIIHGGATHTALGGPADGDAAGARRSIVRGVTTAATIYLAAAIGAAAGQGQLLLAFEATVASIFLLEVRHVRALRWLDGRYWHQRLDLDEAIDEDER